jgi:hypothetical protein
MISVDAVISRTIIPPNVKQIPVFISHDSQEHQLVNITSGNTAQNIVQKLGFTRVSWKICSGIAADDRNAKGEEHDFDDFALRIPEQLDDIINFLEGLGLAKP